ncbi:MAG: copper resistance protein CopC [Gammaproteobacteria bacterium]|nr:copper resistance protein CopC [Gammaproteobacteria bacterium]
MCGRMTRYLLGLLLVCTFATSSPQGFAHAVLLDSSPKPGEMLMQSPSEVVANFNEGVGPIFFKVLDVKGQPVGDPGEIRLDGTARYASERHVRFDLSGHFRRYASGRRDLRFFDRRTDEDRRCDGGRR